MGTFKVNIQPLLILMYHRASFGKHGNSPAILEEHFRYIQKRYTTHFPGETLKNFKLNLCLTFDDATFDFYYIIYPLLKAFKLKALLAVPSAFIQTSSRLNPMERLKLLKNFSFKSNPAKDAFCSWEELKEMVQSGYVQLASHSHRHLDLTSLKDHDLEEEVVLSRKLIYQHTHFKVTTFVYPYGKFNAEVQERVKKLYPYTMRIGSSFNMKWKQSILYRVSSDHMVKAKQVFEPKNLLIIGLKSLSRLLHFFR